MDLLRICLPFTAAAYLASAAAFALAAEPPTKLAAPARPNILWITCEDMSPNLGCYGDVYATTPHLDALSKQGVRYTHAFATASVCSPARCCLITGRYATSLGTQNLRSTFPVPADCKGFPSYLRKAGYFTSNNVKTDYNLAGEAAFIRDCWDRCDARAHWRQRRPGQPFFSVFNIMDTHQTRSNAWSQAEFEKEIGARLTAAERHDPAKAAVPPFYPDTPLTRRTLARYYDCITAMDKEAGRLLKQLDEDGLAGETIVFFFSDGGMGLPRGKRTNYDTGLRVPLIVRMPDKFRQWAPAAAGGTTDRLVSFVDFAPTVLSLTGQPIPDAMQGRPFLGDCPNFRPSENGTVPLGHSTDDSGRLATCPTRDYIFAARDRVDEVFDCSRAVRDARWLYVRNYMPHLSWMPPEGFSDQSLVRQELVQLAAAGKLDAAQTTYAAPTRPLEELYDTEADPWQLHNLAAAPEHRDVLERMRSQLRAWLLEVRDVGFLTEHDVATRTGGRPAYEWARQQDAYPLERVLAAAELVGRDDAPTKQIALLADADRSVRYWAAVGLRAQGPRAADATQPLRKALDDASANVRIEAAAVLAGLGETERPLKVLLTALNGPDAHVAVHAARTLQLLGEHARSVVKEMRTALETFSQPSRTDDTAMFVQFALKAALKKLDAAER